MKNEEKSYYVYLIQGVGTNSFKIGLSRDVDRRVRALSLPFKTTVLHRFMVADRSDATRVEDGLHKLYRDRRLQGEWFHDIDPKYFIGDAEWIIMKMFDRAENDYLRRTGVTRKKPGRPSKAKIVKPPRYSTEEKDKAILQTLRDEGLDAALKLRKEFNG